MLGKHAELREQSAQQTAAPYAIDGVKARQVPPLFPSVLLNRLSARAAMGL
ncbi:hypothetical protein [Leisingera sp.]|uniref:hypothetical protein n=1 Tax=Leisingera sp. TaxID=1879318 RepID=UPI002B2702A8|nr:hypothetical protein [Leisingera sp.]